MDEPETAQDFAGDTTQPTGEILAALSQNNSTHSIKTEPDSPASEFDALFSRLSEEPQNPDGWRRLISLATSSNEIAKIQQAYDELLKHYPNTVRNTYTGGREIITMWIFIFVCSLPLVVRPDCLYQPLFE